jgi:hypothetical protein
MPDWQISGRGTGILGKGWKSLLQVHIAFEKETNVKEIHARRSELVYHNLELSRFHFVRNSSSNLTDSRHLNEIFFDTL